ncbi:hypothetical protein AtNW77_Chr1g0033391 [Arabidopsis thaliana]|uniref:KIB1-4 beta-propeller domain-containing protein n=2 Tax=Arabidopsis TaxID=3701 RepID=A0A178WFG6_ARATH|nr:hypothetical protein ISN45_At01g029930 [Arabidopsis thaliana x Arabidopsis arenosa]OAP17078.1 hypothetical protein AXX17_AT1G30570 [Arabidopsis thaliana]
MSRLLSKLSPLIHKRSVRSFSSSTTGPYLQLSLSAKPSSEGVVNIGEIVLYDPAKQELLNLTDKPIPEEIVTAKWIGASKGWAFFLDTQDRCVLITDSLNPWACKSNPKLLTLPPLNPLFSCQTDVIWNVAMSSCPDDDEDWVVGIKSLGDQVSFCRPRRDLRWTKFQTPSDHFPTSNLTYSKRDRKFYLPGPGGHHLLSYDLDFNKADQPEFHELQFRNFPESLKYDSELSELFPSSCRTERFVESPSGDERFLVKWYAKGCLAYSSKITYETQRFMVFREEETTEERFMCYTDDIGDLCIFVSKSEAFCVPASSYPGLKPNSIYFVGFGLGIYDLTTRDVSIFRAPKDALNQIVSPYWFPPASS